MVSLRKLILPSLAGLMFIRVWGQEYISIENPVVNSTPLSARAAGMGNAFIAVADDYTATYYNPAGITQIKRFEVFTNLLQQRLGLISTLAGEEHEYSNQATRFGALGLVVPYPTYRGSLVFALGYHRLAIFDKIVGLENNTVASVKIYQEQDITGGLAAWSVAGGIDISPKVSVGLALNLLDGNNTTYEEAQDTSGTYTYWHDLDYDGFSARLGLLAKLSKFMKYGLCIETPIRLSEEGPVKENTSPANLDNTIDLPFKLTSGLALYFPYILVAIDLEYIDWSQLRFNRSLEQDHRETINLHCGAESLLPVGGLKLRAGYMYRPVVFKGQGVENQRHTATIGLGTLIDKVVTIDAAFLYSGWKISDIGISTEKYTNLSIFLSGAYRF